MTTAEWMRSRESLPAFFRDVRFIAMAHRGATEDHSENSAEAFEAAISLGFRFVETDARLTKDGVVVLFHDADLERMTGDARRIGDLTYADLQCIALPGGETVPRLDEVLSSWPNTRWNIDPKEDQVVAPLAVVLRRTGGLHRFCVGSFHDHRIAQMRALCGAELTTAMGRWGALRLRLSSWGLPLSSVRADCAQLPLSHGPVPLIDQALVRRAHALKLPVIAWTIDDPNTVTSLIELGVDGIMTDRAALLKTTLEDLHLWE